MFCYTLKKLLFQFFIYNNFFQVEEIDDVDGNFSDPFVAAAVANEKELALSEEQKKKYKKVAKIVLFLTAIYFLAFLCSVNHFYFYFYNWMQVNPTI